MCNICYIIGCKISIHIVMEQSIKTLKILFTIAAHISLGYYNKYHRLTGLDNKRLFLSELEAGKAKIKAPAELMPHEGPFPNLQTVDFLPHSHMTEVMSSVSSYTGRDPILRILFSWPNHIPDASPPNIITLVIRA